MSATRPETTGRKSASTTTSATVEPLLVRPRQAWRMLNCGNSYGYQLIASGEIESFLDGAARKITVASIHRFIARKLAAAGPDGKPIATRHRKARASSSDGDQRRVAA